MIFITGGVRSGKSAFAEKLASQNGPGKNYYYIAAGAAFDDEMKARIKRHQLDRQRQSTEWRTIEIHVNIPEELGRLSENDVVLFECVTTWLSNVLYESESAEQRSEYIHNSIEMLKSEFDNWHAQGAQIIIVSNEVLDEQSSKFDEVNLYRKNLGQLHQWFVNRSEEAYEVQFQLVQQWK
ncbi:bifunctional adenosylcobinamide kinase/adenosylcobinamide-phosphate guanylyltransferase [Solibacillus silvestris]|uniref:bifunctional adenosylcobinamide kinase/adenosylcobinamide-phosphate guanylyltransferase n=1 Tax=Solibacillus silvestris TaxID=76853 RepID=UPI003F7F12AB